MKICLRITFEIGFSVCFLLFLFTFQHFRGLTAIIGFGSYTDGNKFRNV